jgi:LAGLIDADG endonuclease
MIDPVSSESYRFILENIAKFLSTNLRIVTQKNRNRSYYRIARSSYLSRSIIIKYLTMYPLYSSKYLNYLDWKEASLIKMKNKVLSEEEKNII